MLAFFEKAGCSLHCLQYALRKLMLVERKPFATSRSYESFLSVTVQVTIVREPGSSQSGCNCRKEEDQERVRWVRALHGGTEFAAVKLETEQ